MCRSEYTRLSLSDEGRCCSRWHKEALPFHDSSSLFSESDPSSSTSELVSIAAPQLSLKASCTVYYTNCRSLLPKIDHLRAVSLSTTPSVLALCETWLDESVSDLAVLIPNYYLFRRDRNCHGGGLALYVSNDIPSSCIRCHPLLEFLVVELKL